MRLTQHEKTAIYRAIKNDIYVPDVGDFQAAIQQELNKRLAPDVKRFYKKYPNAFKTNYYSTLHIESYPQVYLMHYGIDDHVLKQILQPWIDSVAQRRKLLDDLEGIINSANTSKQLCERLPELVNYFPRDNEPTKNLPVILNIVPTLVKLGFKGKLVAIGDKND